MRKQKIIIVSFLATLLITINGFAQNELQPTELSPGQKVVEQLVEQIKARGQAQLPASAQAGVQSQPATAANSVSQPQLTLRPPVQVVPPPNEQIEGGVTRPAATQSLYEQAFTNLVNQKLPMTTEQIQRLRQVFNASQEAASTPAGIPPKPTTAAMMVDLSPEATPPIIRLGAGYITSLLFLDSTGQPWPIAAYSVGDPESFNIKWDNKGNTLLIQSATFYKRTNLAVILQNLNTPVMLTLVSGQQAIDYRVDLRVPGIGPNALVVQGDLPTSANPVLLDILNGIAPKGSKVLHIAGGDCKAWILNDKLYLRTKLDVISPAWEAIMSSIDGTHAYQLQPAPVILALQHGKDQVLSLTLEGLE